MNENSESNYISRRNILKGVGASASAASVAGCTGWGIGGNGGGELLLWAAPFDEKEWDPWKEWFQEKWQENHDSSVTLSPFEYEDMRQKFLSGGRQGDPDAIEGLIENLPEYINAGLLEPITDQVNDLNFTDGYIEGAWDAMTFKDEVYGLPYFGNGRGLVYRTDIFERNGLEPPETAEEFHEVARTIKENEDIIPFNNCTKEGDVRVFQEWISHVFQFHDNLYVPDGDNWKLQATPETLGTVFDAFYHEPWASDDPFTDPDKRGTGYQENDPGYLNGNIAMIECGTWLLGWMTGEDINNEEKTTQILKENTGVAQLPYAEGGDVGTYLEVKPVMVNKHSDNTDEAFDMVSQFCSPESMNKMPPDIRVTPVHEGLETTMDVDAWKPFIDVMEAGKPLAKISWGPVMDALYGELQQVVYGRKDPMQAGKDLHSAFKGLESEV
ncbi:ABC transporter substrate-binding protein [Halegenticoccus tardaugens]|uniref:ABC transporter substrate-binding protein n=1 Tax=Halegenticoccus tardaugens TaxID=2071624 RepID=UPI00100A9FC8|nr:extracellular solute-binding protein [Halegenticoccus tardaugens]